MINWKLLAVLALSSHLLTACDTTDESLMVGTLERDRIELRVESNEPITAIAVQDGARVGPGDVVLEQEPERFQARLAQVEAQRDQAAGRLAELRRGPREEAIRQAQAQLEGSQALARNAHTEYERALDVFKRGLSNQSVLDSARTAWETLRAREQADREALAALLSGTTVEELQQAQAALAAAEALVSQAGIDLDRLTVRAPMNGIIDKVLYQLGERPTPGATIAVLLDDSRSFARIYVPEHLRSVTTVGAAASITVDGVSEPLSGKVRWVSSDATFTPYFALTKHDRSRLSYLAEIDIENASALPSGIPVQARLAD